MDSLHGHLNTREQGYTTFLGGRGLIMNKHYEPFLPERKKMNVHYRTFYMLISILLQNYLPGYLLIQ